MSCTAFGDLHYLSVLRQALNGHDPPSSRFSSATCCLSSPHEWPNYNNNMSLATKTMNGIATRAEGAYTVCGPGDSDFELSYLCEGPACSSLDSGFQSVVCHKDGSSRLVCSNDAKCQPGTSLHQSNFSFSQNEPDPWSPTMENKPDIWVPQDQHILVGGCTKFSLTSDGTKEGTLVHDESQAVTCPNIEGLALIPGTSAEHASVSFGFPHAGTTQNPFVSTSVARRRSIRPELPLLLAFLLVVMLQLPESQAMIYHHHKVTYSSLDHTVRGSGNQVRAFAEDLRADISQRAERDGSDGNSFATKLVADVISSVCQDYFEGSAAKSFAPEIAQDCVALVYSNDPLPQPGLQFLAVFGASLLCNLIISQSYSSGHAFSPDGCEGLQELVSEARMVMSAPLQLAPAAASSPKTSGEVSHGHAFFEKSPSSQSTQVSPLPEPMPLSALSSPRSFFATFTSIRSPPFMATETLAVFSTAGKARTKSPSGKDFSIGFTEALSQPTQVLADTGIDIMWSLNATYTTSTSPPSSSFPTYIEVVATSIVRTMNSDAETSAAAQEPTLLSIGFQPSQEEFRISSRSTSEAVAEFTSLDSTIVQLSTNAQLSSSSVTTDHPASSIMTNSTDLVSNAILPQSSILTAGPPSSSPGILLSRLRSMPSKPTSPMTLSFLDIDDKPSSSEFEATSATVAGSQSLSQRTRIAVSMTESSLTDPTLAQTPSLKATLHPLESLSWTQTRETTADFASSQESSAAIQVESVVATVMEVESSSSPSSQVLAYESSSIEPNALGLDLSTRLENTHTEFLHIDSSPTILQLSDIQLTALTSRSPQSQSRSSEGVLMLPAPGSDSGYYTRSPDVSDLPLPAPELTNKPNEDIPNSDAASSISTLWLSSTSLKVVLPSQVAIPSFLSNKTASTSKNIPSVDHEGRLSTLPESRMAFPVMSSGLYSRPSPSPEYRSSSDRSLEPIVDQLAITDESLRVISTAPPRTIYLTVTHTHFATISHQSPVSSCPDNLRAPDFCPGIGCVNLAIDRKHCGGCNQVCHHNCHHGICVCSDVSRPDRNDECNVEAESEKCSAEYTRDKSGVCTSQRSFKPSESLALTLTRPPNAELITMVTSLTTSISFPLEQGTDNAALYVPPGSSSSRCPLVLSDICSGGCVNTRSEGNDCGGCGKLCSGTCVDGQCSTSYTQTPPQLAPSGRTVTTRTLPMGITAHPSLTSTAQPIALYIWRGLAGLRHV